MEKSELVQLTIVAVIVLVALLWVAVRILRLAKKNNAGSSCSCCSDANVCKAKELKQRARNRHCHDGQSARN